MLLGPSGNANTASFCAPSLLAAGVAARREGRFVCCAGAIPGVGNGDFRRDGGAGGVTA